VAGASRQAQACTALLKDGLNSNQVAQELGISKNKSYQLRERVVGMGSHLEHCRFGQLVTTAEKRTYDLTERQADRYTSVETEIGNSIAVLIGV
jgi:hypothetical protein